MSQSARRYSSLRDLMTRAIAVVGAALVLQASTVAAQSPARAAFEFRNHHLGDSEKALNEKGARCMNSRQPHERFCGIASLQLGTEETSQVYTYLDDRLKSIYVGFKSEQFPAIVDLYTAKYGKPDSAATAEIHNRVGAAFTNTTLRWFFLDGDLVLQRYGSTVTDGAAVIINKALAPAADSLKKAATADAVKKDM